VEKVTLAIKFFVVITRPPGKRIKIARFLQDTVSIIDMLLDNVIFTRSQGARLFQDLVRNTKLPQVVEQTRDF